MAYGSREFMKDLALYSAGAAIGAKNSAKFVSYAAKKGIQLAGVGATRVAPVVGRGALSAARANPYASAAALGVGLQQAGAFDPVTEAIEAEVQRRTAQVMAPIEVAQMPIVQEQARTKVRRKVSKYQAAVKAAMKAVKASKFGGKKGKISNAKSTFGAVNKVASAVNRGKKVAKTGLRGVAARAIRKVLPKKKKAAPRKSKIDIKVNR